MITSKINIIVEKVRIEGKGAILLTGPSSCGKGEIASELRRILSIPQKRHFSMGNLLRQTIEEAKENHTYKRMLDVKYQISDKISIFDENHNNEDLIKKAMEYKEELEITYANPTQFNWLEFCVTNGLLVPDKWTIGLIDSIFETKKELKNQIFILDGYPRTKKAAEALLNTFERLNIPIIKVIHLSITKEEMHSRALGRKRLDDTIESLERRYQFYIEHVQPTIDYFKIRLGSSYVGLIDAHQPVIKDGKLDVKLSIKHVALSVLQSLGIPSYLLE